MNISIINRQQRQVVIQTALLVLFLFLLAYNVIDYVIKFQDVANKMSVTNDQLSGEIRDVPQHSSNKTQKRLPDVILVGVKKSGTMTLTKFLNFHPSIAAAGDIFFFENDENFNKGIEFYRNKMPRAEADQVVLVKTPYIFQQYDPVKCLRRQRETLPNTKVIFIVRNPIERLVSDLVHYQSSTKRKGKPIHVNQLIMGEDPNGGHPYYPDLNTSIYDSVFLMSNYSNLWNQLTTVYPKEQILLVNGNDFTSEPLKVLRNVENFIRVPHFFKENHFNFSGNKGYPCFTLDKDGCGGKGKAREHPQLHEETLTFLQNHFAPMLKEFEIQTGMKLALG